MSQIEMLPDEVLNVILSQLGGKTLMVILPQVCKRWRAMCQDNQQVLPLSTKESFWTAGSGILELIHSSIFLIDNKRIICPTKLEKTYLEQRNSTTGIVVGIQ